MNRNLQPLFFHLSAPRFLFTVVVFLFNAGWLSGQVSPFHLTPDWESDDTASVSTGLAIADINRDGWDDIIVANGNDIHRQSLAVYYNIGDGSFHKMPSWTSSDIDYHGHLTAGDINGDGYPEVAVSVFLGPAGFSEPGGVKVYFNHNGQLESQASYRTADSMFTFSCALGDADGDGDLDLAVAGGQAYDIGLGPNRTVGRVYFNENGVLQPTPGWTSQQPMDALDVDFADMDNNGYLDLIFANHYTPAAIFLADQSGQLAVQPAWRPQGEDSSFANSITVADFDNNAFPDLVISSNEQLGGDGRFKGYFFGGVPAGSSLPDWLSGSGGYGSAVLAEDVNNDGDTDLLAGRWWGKVMIYRGTANGLETVPAWQSLSSSVLEAFALRDVDRDGRFAVRDTFVGPQNSGPVLRLSDSRVEKIDSVLWNGQSLLPGDGYSTLPGGRWISIGRPLQAGDSVTVAYRASADRDLVVTNWDQTKGNYLFYNSTGPSAIVRGGTPPAGNTAQVYPNPFNQSCRFQIRSTERRLVQLRIYDITGRLIREIYHGFVNAGNRSLRWDGTDGNGRPLGSGIYLYQLRTGTSFRSGKLVLVR